MTISPTPTDLQLAAQITDGKHGWWPCKPQELAVHLSVVRQEGFQQAGETILQLTSDMSVAREELAKNASVMRAASARITELEQVVSQHEASRARVVQLISDSQKKGLGQICHFTIQDLKQALQL